MLYGFLKERYRTNEPIFLSDIQLPVSDTNLRQMFKKLCDEGKIRRYETGVYYLPSVSRLKNGVTLSASTVAQYKYVARNGDILGYYSGFTFANQMGLTAQVPYSLEIVSNAATANTRPVELGGQRIILRKPRAPITAGNCKTLQFLDLLKDVNQYADQPGPQIAARLAAYVRDEKIQQKDIDQYLPLYPDRVYKNLYEMRLYNAFTQ